LWNLEDFFDILDAHFIAYCAGNLELRRQRPILVDINRGLLNLLSSVIPIR
jgi:hypothetical protein